MSEPDSAEKEALTLTLLKSMDETEKLSKAVDILVDVIIDMPQKNCPPPRPEKPCLNSGNATWNANGLCATCWRDWAMETAGQ